MRSEIGNNIRRLRKDKGLSVDELAARIGKNRATIYRWENGDIENLPTTAIEPIAVALDVSPADLLMWNQVDRISQYADAFSQMSFEKLVCSIKNRKDIIELIEVAKDSSPEDVYTAKTMLVALTNKDKQSL